jgi:hypothetical protein
MLCRLIPAGLVLTTILDAGVSLAATDSTRAPIVICTREVGHPWSLLAHGDLVRTELANRIEYRLEVRGQTFLYSVESHAEGRTQMSFPPSLSLIRHLVEKSPQQTTPRGPTIVPRPSYSLSVDTEGNIREYAMLPTVGPLALITVAGSACPPEGKD